MPDTERFQSTPSLRRATAIIIEGPLRLQVSIHALLAESDERKHKMKMQITVSIHALLAESDECGIVCSSPGAGFNPRPPCGERPRPSQGRRPGLGFQSTPSLRRATAPTVHVVNQSCKRGFAPTSRRRHITYRLLFIMFECQSTFSNVLQESPTSRQFDVSLGLAQRPCQTALK